MKKMIPSLLSAFVVPAVLLAAGPWDAWRKGYNAFEKGVRLKENGEYQRARAAFQEAMTNYDAVRKARPDWNQRVIQNRINDSKKAIAEIDQLLTSSNLAGATGVSSPEIERLPKTDYGRTPAAVPVSVPAKTQEPVVSQAEFDRVSLESERYRKRLLETLVELEDVRRELARNKASSEEIGNLLRERRVSEERYNLLKKRYAELEKQLKKPNSRISELESKVLELQLSLDLEKKRTAAMETKWKKADDDALRQAGLFRAANERLSAAQAELDKMTAALTDLRRARDASAELNVRRDQELNQCRLDLRSRDQQLAARQNEIRELLEKVESLRRGAVSQESVAGNLIEENKKLRGEIGELRKQSSAAQSESNEKQSQIRMLQQEILQQREAAQRTGTRLEQSAAEAAALKKDLERERSSAKFMRSEMANWRERCRKLENDVKEWSDRSARFEERVKNLTSSNFNAVEAAEREKKRLESEITSLTERFAVLQARGDQLEEQRKQSELLRAKEHEMLTALNKKTRTLEDAAQRTARQQQLMQKKINLLQEKAAAAGASQQQLNAVQLRLREVTANFQALRGENAQLKEKLNEAERLRRDLAAAQSQAGSLASIQKNLTAQQQENQKLREHLLTARNQLQLVKKQLLARQAEAQEAAQAVKAAQVAQVAEAEKAAKAAEAVKAAQAAQVAEAAKAAKAAQAVKAAQAAQVAQAAKAAQAVRAAEAARAVQAAEIAKAAKAVKAAKAAQVAEAAKAAEAVKAAQAAQAAQAAEAAKAAQAVKAAEAARAAQAIEAAKAAEAVKAAREAQKNVTAPLPMMIPPAPRRAVSGSTKELIEAGLKAEKEDKIALAIWNYETVLELDPVNAEGAMRLGMIQLKRQVYEQAEKYLALARSSGRNDPALRIAHAEALIGLKKYGNALEVLSPLLQKNDAPAVELALPAAAAYLGSGKSAKAEDLLRAAIRRNPEAAAPKRELARILIRTERCNNEALELYRRSKELGSVPDAELEKALGKLFEERRELNNFMASAAREAEKANDWLSAAWYYRQMLDQEKRSSVLAAHLAFAQLQSKNSSAALETLTLNPPSAVGSLIAALARFRNGEPEQTVKAAKQVVALNRGKRLELLFPEWQLLKTALDEAVAKPTAKMQGAAKALQAAYY